MDEKKKKRRRLPSWLRWTLWVLLFQLVLINISASIYAYRLTHFTVSQSADASHSGKNIFSKTWKLFTGPHYLRPAIKDKPSYAYDTVQLTTQNGTVIDAWYAQADSTARGTVILFHGVGASKGLMLPEAAAFRQFGYNVFLVDFRGHGNSAGNSTTMGMRETEEVKLAYAYIQQRGEKTIILWGASMGAVVLAKAVGEYSLTPAALILEMPFSSLQSHLKARARVLGFPQQPFAFLVTGWIGLEQGYNGYRHSAVRYAKKINCPVLMQYGEKDPYVLREEVDEIYNALASPEKSKAGYPNAWHESLVNNDGELWEKEVTAFLKGLR
ncbi:MAG: alpha/beta fold hydrolase [Chitinophagales bacterium]|nr:alpha/beta fold hydrolase [Chitinophagales bacterium]